MPADRPNSGYNYLSKRTDRFEEPPYPYLNRNRQLGALDYKGEGENCLRKRAKKTRNQENNLGEKKENKVTDRQSGFRAYSRNAIRCLVPTESDMGVSAEILMDARENGLSLKEVPINCSYKVDSHSAQPISHGLSVIGSIIKHIETEHALLTFGVPGFIMFTAGLVLDIHVWNVYTSTSELAVGLALITVILVMLGVLLGFTGLILHAVINAARRKW